jgi:hypothetical protein
MLISALTEGIIGNVTSKNRMDQNHMQEKVQSDGEKFGGQTYSTCDRCSGIPVGADHRLSF